VNTLPQGPVVDALQYPNWTRAVAEDWRAGGLSAVHVTVAYHERARETLSRLGAWNRRLREHADLLRPVRRGADLDAARREGRTGVVLGAQNCSPIEDELDLVEVMNDAGLKVMQLTYNTLSLCGAGCYETDDPGLSRFGRLVVAEMNRVGMVIDMSHSAERTTLETIEASTRPIATTHANPRFFHDVPRNKSEAVLRALAESGGMLGFSLYPPHLPDGSACSLEAFARMVARTADLMGAERLGIGSDLCRGWGGETLDWMRNGRWRPLPEAEREALHAQPWPDQPPWFQASADMANLAAALLEAGFSEDEAAGILGGNWHRFFRQALEPAAITGEAHPSTSSG